MALRHVDILDAGKELFSEFRQDDVPGLAAELSYRFLFALFPFFIFLAAIGAFLAEVTHVENPTQSVMDMFAVTLPADASNVVRQQMEGIFESRSAGLLSAGILGAIWAAAGGFGAVMKAMNRVYDVEETRPFWRRSLLAVGFTLLAGSFFVGAFVLLVVGQLAGHRIAEALGVGADYAALAALARLPLALLLLLVAIAFLYFAAPNAHVPFHWVSPGAVLFVAVWTVATLLFGLYVANFGAYNEVYGALGGMAVLMVWFYLSSLILLTGAELNAVVYRRAEREAALKGARPHPRPGAEAADADRTPASSARETRGTAPRAAVSTPDPPAAGWPSPC